MALQQSMKTEICVTWMSNIHGTWFRKQAVQLEVCPSKLGVSCILHVGTVPHSTSKSTNQAGEHALNHINVDKTIGMARRVKFNMQA